MKLIFFDIKGNPNFVKAIKAAQVSYILSGHTSFGDVNSKGNFEESSGAMILVW